MGNFSKKKIIMKKWLWKKKIKMKGVINLKVFKKKLKKKWKIIKDLIICGIEIGMNYKKNENLFTKLYNLIFFYKIKLFKFN